MTCFRLVNLLAASDTANSEHSLSAPNMVVLRNRIDDRGSSKNLVKKLKPNVELQHFVNAQLHSRALSGHFPTPTGEAAAAITCASEEIVNSLFDQWGQLYDASDLGHIPALLPCSAASVPIAARAQSDGCSVTTSRNVRYVLQNRLTVRY